MKNHKASRTASRHEADMNWIQTCYQCWWLWGVSKPKGGEFLLQRQLLRKALPTPATQRRQQAQSYRKLTAASKAATLPGDRLQNDGGPSQAHSKPKNLVTFPPKSWFSFPHSTGNETVWIRHPGQFFICKLAIITFLFCHLLTAMPSGSWTLTQYIQHLTQWGV